MIPCRTLFRVPIGSGTARDAAKRNASHQTEVLTEDAGGASHAMLSWGMLACHVVTHTILALEALFICAVEFTRHSFSQREFSISAVVACWFLDTSCCQVQMGKTFNGTAPRGLQGRVKCCRSPRS